MKPSFFKVVVLGAMVSVVTLAATAALAGTGIGAVFNLGRSNSVNATTTLTGSAAGKELQVTNASTARGATGIGIKVAPGKPPITVNSSARVHHLNASLLGGRSAGKFVQGTGSVVGSLGSQEIPSTGESIVLGGLGHGADILGDCNFSGHGDRAVLEVARGAPVWQLNYATTDGAAFVGGGFGGAPLALPITTNDDQMATAQLAFGSQVDTITVSEYGDSHGNCFYTAQAVISVG